MGIQCGNLADNGRPGAVLLAVIAGAAAAFAARPPDPYDGLPVVEPAATNLSVQLVLPDFVEPGVAAEGRVAYSNLLSSAVVSAPVFTLDATDGTKFADGTDRLVVNAASNLTPGGKGEARFSFTALSSHKISLSIRDANAPAALSSASPEDAQPVAGAVPFAAFLPCGPAPLTTRLVALNTRRATSHLWRFPDGTVSTEEMPEHTFASPGVHAVTLALSYADGGTNETFTVTNAVTAWDAPNAISRIQAVPVASNTLYFAFAADVYKDALGVKKVRRFYGGVAGTFAADVKTTVSTPDGAISGGIDATVDFGTPPLMLWAGPKATASATIGADLEISAHGRFARGVRYDGDGRHPRHVGGAAVETGAVSVPRLFADATVFAGMEVGAAFGVESPLGGLSATFFSISAAAGVRGDVSAEIAGGARSLDVTVRPVVEAEFVPVSVNVFDIVDLTPVEKSWTLYEGPAWVYRYADTSAPGDVRIQSLPVLAVRGLEVAKPSGMKPALASSWLESNGLSGRNATDADAARILGRPSGKLAADGTALYLWHDFVAGTDPSDANDAFRAKIEIDAAGNPVVSPVPGPLAGRIYTVEGKAELGDEWHPATGGDRFFRIKVDVAADEAR